MQRVSLKSNSVEADKQEQATGRDQAMREHHSSEIPVEEDEHERSALHAATLRLSSERFQVSDEMSGYRRTAGFNRGQSGSSEFRRGREALGSSRPLIKRFAAQLSSG